MRDSLVDLWPKDIETRRTLAPATILRQQSSLLAQKTSNLVHGEVVDKTSSRENFVYMFYLVAPALNNYSYLLLTLYHDIALYPVRIVSEDTILSELTDAFEVRIDEYEDSYVIVRNQDEYENTLRGIFGSEKCIQVITSLLSQSDPQWSGEVANNSQTGAVADEDIPF